MTDNTCRHTTKWNTAKAASAEPPKLRCIRPNCGGDLEPDRGVFTCLSCGAEYFIAAPNSRVISPEEVKEMAAKIHGYGKPGI